MALDYKDLQILTLAAKYLVDDGDNTEYLRGVCELIADVTLSEGEEHYVKAMGVARDIGIPEINVLKMYNL